MEGLGPEIFLQIREDIGGGWAGDGLSLGKPCRVLLSYTMKKTANAKCSVEMEMPVLLVEIHIASISFKQVFDCTCMLEWLSQ